MGFEQEITVVTVVDDSQLMDSFEEINAEAEQLDETMGDLSESIDDAFKPRGVQNYSKALQGTQKELKKTGDTAKKTSRNMSTLNKTGGRGISMLSRFTGVGGRAARSLGGLSFALAGSPFGAFALAAAAATTAYSFFADKLGLNNDEIIKKNKELSESISKLTTGLEADFQKGKLLAIDLKDITEAEKRIEKISLTNEQLGALRLELSKENAISSALQNKLDTNAFKTETERLELKKALLESDTKRFDLAFKISQSEGKIAAFEKANAQERENRRNQRIKNEQDMFNLFNSLIRDNRQKAILALEASAKVREEKAMKAAKDTEEANRFILESQEVLRKDIEEVNSSFDAAELKARNALLVQLTNDSEKAALLAAQQSADQRKADIESIAIDKNEQAELLKQSEEKLQSDLAAIRKDFAEKRLTEGLAEQQKFFDSESALLEAEILRQTSVLNQEQELARQKFATEARTEEEITAFKEEQDEKRLTAELNYQIQRLQLVRDFNTQISNEERAALDAQIAALETKLKGVSTKIKGNAKTDAEQGDGLFGLMGISADNQKDIQAIQGALEQVTGEISKAVAERIAILDKEIEARNQRVSEVQKDLANEIELQKEGNASNVKLFQDRLAKEKAERDRAEKEREEAAKAQFILDTALQTSNLITAISSLYSSLASLPFGIGVALATALSGVMIGTFIASKASAANAAGFADGGFYGYTGDGGKYQESKTLGSKPYNYHKGEYILDAETTEALGLNNVPMSEAKEMLLGNASSDSIPSPTSVIRKNKSISRQSDKKTSDMDRQLQIAYSSGVRDAINNQNSILKEIRDKPIAVNLGNGRTKLIYKNKTVIDTDERGK